MRCKKCDADYIVFKAVIDRKKKILSLLYICPKCMAVKNKDIPIVEHFDFREDHEFKKHKNSIVNLNDYFNHR
ncbi:hypothetical protein [Deferribacter abyssi]|uniref:hypothetical protein n=1 Tax=Deferribacter abyssi TaxID=213806 RepID=UPI003C21BCE5